MQPIDGQKTQALSINACTALFYSPSAVSIEPYKPNYYDEHGHLKEKMLRDFSINYFQ